MDRTPRAEAAIARSRVVVGYAPYLENISDILRYNDFLILL